MRAARLTEMMNICAGFLPVDLQTGANNGDWVSLAEYDHCAVVFYKDGGTAGDDPTITLEQASDTSGTGAKALTFADIFIKQDTSLLTVGQYTHTTQTATNTYTDTTSAEDEAIWVIQVDAEDLDVDNDFDCLRATVADVGCNAQIGCLFYLLYGPRAARASLLSAL